MSCPYDGLSRDDRDYLEKWLSEVDKETNELRAIEAERRKRVRDQINSEFNNDELQRKINRKLDELDDLELLELDYLDDDEIQQIFDDYLDDIEE